MTSQVADTQKHADLAVKLAVVEYDLKNVEAPVLSVEDAVNRSSLFEVPSQYQPEPVGDVSEGMAEADRKIRSVEVLETLLFSSFRSIKKGNSKKNILTVSCWIRLCS